MKIKKGDLIKRCNLIGIVISDLDKGLDITIPYADVYWFNGGRFKIEYCSDLSVCEVLND